MNKLSFWAIMLIPVLWGVSYPLTRNAVSHINPGVFAFSRQLVAVLCFLPFMLPIIRNLNRQLLIGAACIGICNTVCTLSISYALATISSALTAFFVTLNIIFVPFIAALFGLGRIKAVDIMTVIIGLLSILVTFHITSFSWNMGEVFGLIAALSFAMQLVIMQKFSTLSANAPLVLACFSTLFSIILLLYFPLHYVGNYHVFVMPVVWIAIFYQGVVATALVLLLQLYFSNEVGATRTAIILNLDLVFASLFGLVNGEKLTIWQIGGILLALLAVTIHDIFPQYTKFME